MTTRVTLPDWLSASRIPLAIMFVLFYSPSDHIYYTIGILIVLIALLTDISDGYLARKLNISSFRGYMLDGLGDKVFYVALIVVAIRDGYCETMLGLILISREIALYAVRSIDAGLKDRLPQFRLYSKTHALFIRIYFATFLIWPCRSISPFQADGIYNFGRICGWTAAAVGCWGLVLVIRRMWAESIER